MNLFELIKVGGQKLQNFVGDIWKKIADWFLKNKKYISNLEELLGLGLIQQTIAKLEGLGLKLKSGTSIAAQGVGGKTVAIYHKGVKIFEGLPAHVKIFSNKLEKMGKEAAEKYLDGLLEKFLDDFINSQNFAFRKLAYVFSHTLTIAKDGTKEIYHYLIINGQKKLQGFSTISKEGVLFNVFDVTEQQKEISTAMYKLLDKIGFEKIEGSYGSGSLGTNYKEFMKVYNITKDAEAAAFATPAGKALNKALDNKFKPVDIVITR